MLKNVANAKDQVFMTTAQTRGPNKLNEDYPQKEVIKGLHEDLMAHILVSMFIFLPLHFFQIGHRKIP